METIEKYQKAKEFIINSYSKEKIKVDDLNKDWKEKHWKLRDQKREIQTQISNLQYEKEETIKKINVETSRKTAESKKLIAEYNRIMEFIKVYEGEKRDLKISCYYYDRSKYPTEKVYLKPIDTIFTNEYLNIQVFIYFNSKLTNKYSLCFVGYSIFNEDIIKFPKSYGLNIHAENRYFQIEVNIKDLPTEKALIEYYNKIKNKYLFDFLTDHELRVKEYLEVVVMYSKDINWKIAYLEHQKEYYEKNYSRGTETEEYKKIIKELESIII